MRTSDVIVFSGIKTYRERTSQPLLPSSNKIFGKDIRHHPGVSFWLPARPAAMASPMMMMAALDPS